MPAGRPSTYDPAYCDQVIEWGKLGKSRTWMAAQIGVARKTIYEWESSFPDFCDAMTCAMALSQAWWEDAGQDNMLQTGFSASAWSRSMAARFPEDWREKTETKHVGPNDGPVQIESSPGEMAMALLSKLVPQVKDNS